MHIYIPGFRKLGLTIASRCCYNILCTDSWFWDDDR